MHIYVRVYEELFFQSMISEHGIAIATWIFGLVLNAFWKRALQMLRTLLNKCTRIKVEYARSNVGECFGLKNVALCHWMV